MFVITDLRLDRVVVLAAQDPERTPVGPFETREDAWAYAFRVQAAYGSGVGSVEISPLHAPLVLDAHD